MHRRLALVRRPSPRLADGIVTHIDRSERVDADLALEQWRDYVAALHAHGWRTIEAPETPDCPDGVFVEDTCVVYGDVAVLARSGAPQRRAERVGIRAALEGVGYRCVDLADDATLDGGDVLKHDGTMWVGLGGRTNRAGVAALSEAFEPLGVRVVPVALSRVLHLKSAVTALPDGTVVGYEPLVDDPRVWGRFEAVPEEPGAHVVLLGGDVVLMSTSAPRTAEAFRERGLDVVAVDMTEFEKLEGCVTCLSVRLRG